MITLLLTARKSLVLEALPEYETLSEDRLIKEVPP
jgi:hypothetical protein